MRKHIIFLTVCMSALVYAQISSLEDIQISQCGINSLYLCLKYHKADVCLNEIYSSIRPDVQNNVSLKQLADYARSRGLSIKPIIKPTAESIQEFLYGGCSVILQYNTVLPDNSKFKHIVALTCPDSKIFLLDYPSPKRELTFADLVNMNEKSEGALILSEKSLRNLGYLLNLGSLKSVSFYLVISGVLALVLIRVIHFGKVNCV